MQVLVLSIPNVPIISSSDRSWHVIFTGRNEVGAKVMFLLMSVILLTGGVCLSACRDTIPPGSKHSPGANTPREQTPPRPYTPQEQTPPPPPWSRPPSGSRLQHTVNERLVRILLECILVQHIGT